MVALAEGAALLARRRGHDEADDKAVEPQGLCSGATQLSTSITVLTLVIIRVLTLVLTVLTLVLTVLTLVLQYLL